MLSVRREPFVSAVVGLLVLAGTFGSRASARQNPVPLPGDPDLAAYVGSEGDFDSMVLPRSSRRLVMSAYVASYGPQEAVDFGTLLDRAFLTLGLPQEDGWGLFGPAGPNLTLRFEVTDARNRLGSVRVYEHASGRLAGKMPAPPGGGRIAGTLAIDSDVREYRVEVLDRAGGRLVTLAADIGRFDAVFPFAVLGGFEPFRPATIACAHHPGGDNLSGKEGDPHRAPGTPSAAGTPAGFSVGCALRDYTNDNPVQASVEPPVAFARYVKRALIHDSVGSTLGSVKSGDPAALRSVRDQIAPLQATDPDRALANVDFPPYSRGAGHWHVAFRGEAAAVLAVPYERKRKGGALNALRSAITSSPRTRRAFLSSLAAEAARDWLADPKNRQGTGFKAGEVFPLGEVYSLVAAEGEKRLEHLGPVTERVTFRVVPDIAPPGTGYAPPGTGYAPIGRSVDYVRPLTTPPPPPYVGGGPPTFGAGGTAAMRLAKGHEWKATAGITGPGGCEDGSAVFPVPGTPAVTIAARLEVLQLLHVTTTSAGGQPGGATVTLEQNGAAVKQGASTRQQDGSYRVTFRTVTPGGYALKAAAGGDVTPGTKPITVKIAAEQSETIALGPAKPPY